MDNKLKVVGVCMITALSSTPTLAAETYAWLGASTVKYVEKGTISGTAYKGSFDATALSVGLGTDLNQYISVEAMLATGLGDSNVKVTGITIPTTIKVKIDSALGVYGVAKAPLSNSVAIYAKAGITRLSATGSFVYSGTTYSFGVDDTSFSYGAGLDFGLNSNSAIRLEYMNYYDKSSTKVDGVGLAYKMSF